jgi:hypothetical protein
MARGEEGAGGEAWKGLGLRISSGDESLKDRLEQLGRVMFLSRCYYKVSESLAAVGWSFRASGGSEEREFGWRDSEHRELRS